MAVGMKTGGRKAGTPNKITQSVRERFVEAFDKLQSDEDVNLVAWAKNNPDDFYKLASKLIPLDVAVQGGMTLHVITGVPRQEGAEDLA
jgi:hypothetical protein